MSHPHLCGRWPLLPACGLLLAAAAIAAPGPLAATRDPSITAADVRHHVRYLASPELGGRGSGTPGNDLAGDYLAAHFRDAGLKPAGEKGSYFQTFTVQTGVSLGTGNLLVLSGGRAPLRVGEDFMPLSFARNGEAEGPLVFAGYGISRPELGWDDYAGIDVRGKIAVVLRHTPDQDRSGKFAPYAWLTQKTMTAREKGAAGVLLVTGPLGDQPEDLGRFELESSTGDCGIPVHFVRRALLDPLFARAGQKLVDLQTAMAHGKPQSFAFADTTVRMRVEVRKETAPTRNVGGLVEGSDPVLKDEVIVIGAHYDHLGNGGRHSLDGSGKPAIHHGADDNASGTAALLELARYFSANRHELGRSLLFIGFSGEEMGLLGSIHWTRNPTIPLKQVAAMLNLDMVGRMRNSTLSVIGAGTSSVWKTLLEEANKPFGFRLQTTGAASGPFGGSDQQSFYLKEIPVLFFFTGSHSDYHKPSDTWEKVNTADLARLARFVAVVTRRVSLLPARPDYVKVADPTPSTGQGFRVYLGTIPDYAAEVDGVRLDGVREGSPAAGAGLKAGDVLLEVGGRRVRNVQEYTAVLGDLRPNVSVPVVLTRDGKRMELSVTPAARN